MNTTTKHKRKETNTMTAQTASVKTETIPVDLKKLTDLVSLASTMADALEDFGCEDAEFYRQQISSVVA